MNEGNTVIVNRDRRDWHMDFLSAFAEAERRARNSPFRYGVRKYKGTWVVGIVL